MADIIRAEDPACVDRAARLLAAGELVCYPTDTVYGVGALATNDAAVRRLYAVKGRDLKNPMPLLLGDPEAAQWIADVTPAARALMHRFWPGPLTIVMRKAPEFRSLALAGQNTVGLRVPDLDLLRQIIRAVGEPITGTSANRSRAPAPRSAAEVALQIGDMVALIIDGGPARLGLESTVIDITCTPPTVLREGPISREELASALGVTVA